MATRLNVTPERVEIAKLYLVKKWSRKQIAEKFGIGVATVSNIANDPKFRRIAMEEK